MTPRLSPLFPPQCLRIPHLLKIVDHRSCSQTFSTQRPTETSFLKICQVICSIYSLFLSKHDWNTHRNKNANHKYTVWNSPATDHTRVTSRQIRKENIRSPYCLLLFTNPDPRITGILTRNSIDELGLFLNFIKTESCSCTVVGVSGLFPSLSGLWYSSMPLPVVKVHSLSLLNSS